VNAAGFPAAMSRFNCTSASPRRATSIRRRAIAEPLDDAGDSFAVESSRS